MSDSQREAFLKNFESSESFNNFCFGMSKDQIRRLTTDDWTSIFYGINYLTSKLACKSCNEFVKKHTQALDYMYSNYRPNKLKSREIKKFAYAIADKLASSEEFSKLYYDIDVAVWTSRHEDYKVARIMRDTIYKKFIGSHFKAGLLKPFIFINKETKQTRGNKVQAGYYKHNHILPHEIGISSGTLDFCNVVAHEIYHSLQHLGFMKRAKFLKKLGVDFSYDKKMAELYRLNNAYYLNYLTDSVSFRGYKRQPLEYDARLFATCFERRLRKNLRAAENNWGLLYQTVQMLRQCKIFQSNIQYDETGISIMCNVSEPKHVAFLDELVSKHLLGAQIFKNDNASSVLFIPRNAQNIIAINKLHTGSLKSYNENNLEKGFIKRFFPATYNKFFATAEEKLKYQPALKRVMINRLGSNIDKM